MDKSNIGERMKRYEAVSQDKLMPRMPVAIRLDMRAGHTFTRGFKKPFDNLFMGTMQKTTLYLCEEIQNCVCGYTQSDEITLILVDYQTLETSPWFDYRVQKLTSITASMATLAFNKVFNTLVQDYIMRHDDNYAKVYENAIDKGAVFDSRCFNIPVEEVTNLIYWRQLDAVRNSIQMVGQANFSHKQLHQKSCNMIKDMLKEKKNIIWDDLPEMCQWGTCVVKRKIRDYEAEEKVSSPVPIYYNKWIIDTHMPFLKDENRKYIDSLVYL